MYLPSIKQVDQVQHQLHQSKRVIHHDYPSFLLQGTLAAETKGNRDVLLAWIGVAGVVLGPLVLWMANTFFK